ncbi:MAG: PAS domain-containing sensor histidine kinase, partial [Clostridia bacterium]|nr:PAS domain-containing sensor histidine kinase [Clostridia bacterium]
FAETLLEGGADDPEVLRTFLGFIQQEANRLARLVEDLLDLVRVEARQAGLVQQETDLRAFVRRVVERTLPRAREAGLELLLEEPGVPVYATVDRDRIEQVLVNLVDNALKYTPTGGRVTVTLGDEGETVLVRVRDTGPGIPREALARVFERFYRVDRGRSRQVGGTGLGLAIARHIVEAHGGSIWVESEVGRGATFAFRLPKRRRRG